MRSFIAVSPDAATREGIAMALAPLRAELGSVRWVREQHLHVTLAFLGDVDDQQLRPIIDAARQVAVDTTRFRLTISGSGVFPRWSRPRIVWLAFDEAEELASLGASVRSACEGAGWVADKEFIPHLTIGRTVRPLTLTERVRLREGLTSVRIAHPFEVSRVEVLHSAPGPGGPHHSVVAALPLRPA
jgi:2'-5' RNA ligase